MTHTGAINHMPTRILREGILTSKRVNRLAPVAELFYRRLMTVVDDYGRYFADETLLRAACYPYQIKKVDEKSVLASLKECCDAKLIFRYSIDGTEFLQMLDTRQQIRAKSKYPDPDKQLLDEFIASAKQMESNCKENALVVEVEVGVGCVCEGAVQTLLRTENKTAAKTEKPAADKSVGFESFYNAYPKREGRQDALKVWQKLSPDGQLRATIMQALELQKQSPLMSEKRFIPQPARWLRGRRWQDEIPAPHEYANSGNSKAAQSDRALADWLASSEQPPDFLPTIEHEP